MPFIVALPKDAYIAMYVKLYRLLVRPEELSESASRQSAKEDWERDLQGSGHMDMVRFQDALFEMADLCVSSAEPAQYAAFLQKLLRGVAQPLNAYSSQYAWKADADIAFDPEYAAWTTWSAAGAAAGTSPPSAAVYSRATAVLGLARTAAAARRPSFTEHPLGEAEHASAQLPTPPRHDDGVSFTASSESSAQTAASSSSASSEHMLPAPADVAVLPSATFAAAAAEQSPARGASPTMGRGAGGLMRRQASGIRRQASNMSALMRTTSNLRDRMRRQPTNLRKQLATVTIGNALLRFYRTRRRVGPHLSHAPAAADVAANGAEKRRAPARVPSGKARGGGDSKSRSKNGSSVGSSGASGRKKGEQAARAVEGTPAQENVLERQGSWADGYDPFDDLPPLDQSNLRISNNLRRSLR